jgi:transcriptional regulator with AAA-type ATPase domain
MSSISASAHRDPKKLKTPLKKSELLDGGGKPTVRELLSSLVFNPIDRTIRLHGDRIVMQRAAVGGELRRELIRLLGNQEARIFLMRLGFLSGRADARFVRTGWPGLDIGDAFTAGTRLHTFSGVVRVEPIYNEFDFRKKRFAGEFNWYESVEAAEFRRQNQRATEPVCWTQLGYASGYASEFFDTLIVYKEVQCSAEGHRHCRVVGKPADVWGAGDPEVILFRERIAAPMEEGHAESRHALAVRTAETALSALDRIVLAPIREQLDRFASMALPVLIEGAAGTGRSRAARYLQRASGAAGAEFRQISGAEVTSETCAEIARSVRGGRRGQTAATILIEGVERVQAEIQERLASALEEGLLVGGPRVLALATSDLRDQPAGSSLHPSLWYALSALTLRMPSLAERPADCPAIANALLPILAARMGLPSPELDAAATRTIERADWPGNLRQMRSVLGAALAAHRPGGPITGPEIEAQLGRLTWLRRRQSAEEDAGLRPWLDQAFSEGSFSMAELEREVYDTAVVRAEGNLSAAARLLGLSRAQLAYRLTTRDSEA